MTIDEILATIKPYRLCSQVKKAVCEKNGVPNDSTEIICAIASKESIMGIFRFPKDSDNQVYNVTLDEYAKTLKGV